MIIPSRWRAWGIRPTEFWRLGFWRAGTLKRRLRSLGCSAHCHLWHSRHFMARRTSTISNSKPPATESRRPVLSHLKAILASLNPAERAITDCVLGDPEKVIVSSIAEMKEICGASVGSIVAFCRRLGMKGFAEFKIALARELAQSGLPAGQTKPNGSILEKVFQFHAQSLIETLQINPRATFERVAQTLEKVSRIEFFAIGLSYQWPIPRPASSC